MPEENKHHLFKVIGVIVATFLGVFLAFYLLLYLILKRMFNLEYQNSKINFEQFYAASDINLLPRRINSFDIEYLNGMELGCIPVAARVGILNDTVADIFDDMVLGCGFKTKKSLLNNESAEEEYLAILIKALNLFTNNPASWNLLIKNVMNYDARWSFEIIEKYNNIYEML